MEEGSREVSVALGKVTNVDSSHPCGSLVNAISNNGLSNAGGTLSWPAHFVRLAGCEERTNVQAFKKQTTLRAS